MRPLVEIVDGNGAHPLVVLVLEQCASLSSVAALACTCRSIRIDAARWMSAQTCAHVCTGADTAELRRTGRLCSGFARKVDVLHILRSPTDLIDFKINDYATDYAKFIREQMSHVWLEKTMDRIKARGVARFFDMLADIPMSVDLLAVSQAGRAVKALTRWEGDVAEPAWRDAVHKARLVLAQWKAAARVPDSMGSLQLDPLRAAAAAAGVFNVQDVLAGVASYEARFACIVCAARVAQCVQPGCVAVQLYTDAQPMRRKLKALTSIHLEGKWLVHRVVDVSGILASGFLPDLEQINLSGFRLSDSDMKWLSRAVTAGAFERLLKLNLSMNQIDNPGLTVFSQALSRTVASKLQCLMLSSNRFNTHGLMTLVGALKKGSTPRLEVLDVRSDVTYSDVALTAFAELLTERRRLRSLGRLLFHLPDRYAASPAGRHLLDVCTRLRIAVVTRERERERERERALSSLPGVA